MKDDYEFDDIISRAARDLDAPPTPPREAMWSAIQAAREEELAATDDAVVIGAPIPLEAGPKRVHPWLRYGAPLAAMLVLGVSVGRFTMTSRNGSTGVEPVATAATQQAGTRSAATDTQNAGATSTSTATPTMDDDAARDLAALARPPITSASPGATGPSLARSVKRPAAAGAGDVVVRGSEPGTSSSIERTFDTSLPYRMVAIRHFSRVQLLLVALPNDVRDGHINEVAVRAADLLVNTRLLLDSPAAKEHEQRRLLEDLELILAQAATISPTHSADDVNMIQKAINQRDVLIRLHAVTAGPRLSGT